MRIRGTQSAIRPMFAFLLEEDRLARLGAEQGFCASYHGAWALMGPGGEFGCKAERSRLDSVTVSTEARYCPTL